MMADTVDQVRKGLAPERTSTDGDLGLQSADRSGRVLFKDWRAALVDEGRVFTVNVGTVLTPVAGNDPVIGQPELAVRLPAGAGVALRPLSVNVQVSDTVGLDTHIIVAIASIDIGAGTSTDIVATVRSMKGLGVGSRALVRRTYSGAGTSPVAGTDYVELKRAGTLYDIATESMPALALEWEPDFPPIIAAPATLLVYFGGASASTAFVQAVWAEEPLSDIQ